MRATLALAGVALAAAGCTPYKLVFNGGVPVMPGTCGDVALGPDLQLVPAGAPGCDARPGFVVPERAAAVFWQMTKPEWAGPVLAPQARVKVDVPEAPPEQKALVSGDRDKALATGDRDKGLQAGDREKGLQAGDREKRGGHDKALQAGDREKGLQAGDHDEGLRTGDRDKSPTAPGEPAPVERPVLSLGKVGSGRASTTESGRFTLTVANLSDATLSRVVVVDRVARELRVEADQAAVSVLPDGTTLVIFRLDAPLAPGARRSFAFSVFAKPALVPGAR